MDIQLMLKTIYESGFTDAEIAESVSTPDDLIPTSIINRLRRGVHKHTNYVRYKKIADLYEKNKSKAA